ncbi:tetratricopeptide repeat protein [Xanthomonas sacchari]|uniref:tetratricopeptide repeat protein n=1 Tax=Xanthomonas sacchari TaxID=56458 RepID=UPI003B20EDA0
MKAQMGAASVLRAVGQCVLWLMVVATIAPVAAKEKRLDEKRLHAIGRQIELAEDAATEDYLHGDPERAAARLRGAVDETDWLALFALANNVWRLDPAHSFQWHQRAYALSDGNPYALLELALEYTRHEQCAEAADAWQKVDHAGLLERHLPMLAGYCYLQLGQDQRAFAMFERSRSRHGDLEHLLQEVWGQPEVLRAHAERLKAFKGTGDARELDAALVNAIRFKTGADRGRALRVIADAAAHVPRSDLAGPMSCLRPVFEAEAAVAGGNGAEADGERLRDLWKAQMASCKLSVAADPLPDSSALFEFLLVNALNLSIVSRQDVLAAHRDALEARIRSVAGDLTALKVLASLQESLKDPGLKDTDMLGWDRYGQADFAISRIHGEVVQGVLSDEGKALLVRAYAQFPHDPKILQAWLEFGTPDRETARQGWRELILLQFHAPTLETDPIHFSPLARTLYVAINKYRQSSGQGD